ncbi:hypothetical protein LI142_14965 [Eubacterium limosum]|uniref:Uncharacterized protein n=1 Tax=Eubacterium limosum TaxID=1736 RepID=A0ABT5USF4_EUBLI|nr:hypothetical protein [Eubacterium limosum]MCB6570805.1 hypothetical protein [Eubacterium limosum]MDE1471897.1 hypothetical protein [Eubacterium limosum]
MQKIVEIDGKQVLLESNAATPIKYKKQFGKDYFAELFKLVKSIGANMPGTTDFNEDVVNLAAEAVTETAKAETKEAEGGKEAATEETKAADVLDIEAMSWESLDRLDFEPLYNIVWTLAKTADKSLPDPETWLEGFDTFPLMDILTDAVELIGHSIESKKKSTMPALVKNS